MIGITRFTAMTAVGVILTIGMAIGAGVTHATGVSATDVVTIKSAVTNLRHGEPTSIDWYIAVDGPYALVYDGCGPGACNETQLIRQGSRWVVTCYTVEGKGRFGTCSTPSQTVQELRREALSSYHGP
jgi:hypothetical protein